MKDIFYLGADVGGTAVKFVITDAAGEIVARESVPTAAHDPTSTLRTLAERATPPDGADIAGVGLACAGIVNPETGWLGRSPNLPGWQETNLAADVRAAFGEVAVSLANDVNAALYGEFRSGAGRGCRDLVMMALGTGVGGGVIVDGELVIGKHFGAGEIGHMVLDAQGPRCACGSRGCLEAWAGSNALVNRARELVTGRGVFSADGLTSAVPPQPDLEPLAALLAEKGDAVRTHDLAVLAEAGDALCREIFAEAGRRLGQATANLINVLDPDRVIIGGGVAQAGDLILEPCRQVIPKLVLGAEAAQVPVVTAELGPWAASVGAAWLARESETKRSR